MDVVGDAVATVQVGAPHGSRTVQPGEWRGWFPRSESAGFHAVLDGQCWLHPPTGPPVALHAGDVVFLPQGLGHGLASSPAMPLPEASPWRAEISFTAPTRAPVIDGSAELLCGAYVFDRRRAHPLFDDLPTVVHVGAGQHKTLDTVVALLADEMDTRRTGGQAAVTSLLDLALVQLVRLGLDRDGRPSLERPGSWAAALADPVVAAALDAIHAEPAAPWTVESLGRRGGASRATLAERFTRLTGQPPLQYLTWWRMTRAARLLNGGDPDLTLARVARQVGYRSEHAFGKAFKRHHGVAPGRYHRQRTLNA